MMGLNLSAHFYGETLAYTGVELRPHFLLERFGLKGSGIGAFIGPCQVKIEHLVDWEDRLASDSISSRSMIHFIGEFFGLSLREGVLLQRLGTSIAFECLRASLVASHHYPLLRRDGDDLFVGDRKLSVSIVTVSPVSVLWHLGINQDPTGAPVPAIGLMELGLKSEDWARLFLDRLVQELKSIDWACVKVRPVF